MTKIKTAELKRDKLKAKHLQRHIGPIELDRIIKER